MFDVKQKQNKKKQSVSLFVLFKVKKIGKINIIFQITVSHFRMFSPYMAASRLTDRPAWRVCVR